MNRRFIPCLCLALLAACGTTPRTEIMVVVQADDGVRMDATGLRFEVWGRPSDTTDFGDPVSDLIYPQTAQALEFPWRFAIVPDGRDASRFIRVRATAIDAAGAEFVNQSAVTGFIAGKTLELTLHLITDCRDVTCDLDSETCKAETGCIDEVVPPDMLPVFTPTADAGGLSDGDVADGGIADGGIADGGADTGAPPIDSSVPDTGVGTDSGPRDSGTDAGIGMDSGTDAGVGMDSGTGPLDSGTDTGPLDSGTDTGPLDSGTDTGPLDSGTDTGPLDSGTDTGPWDSGLDDCGLGDSGAPDTGPPDSGLGGPDAGGV